MDAGIANVDDDVVVVVVVVVVLYRSSLHNIGLLAGPARAAPVKASTRLNAAR